MVRTSFVLSLITGFFSIASEKSREFFRVVHASVLAISSCCKSTWWLVSRSIGESCALVASVVFASVLVLAPGDGLEAFAFAGANEVETFVFAAATEGGAFTLEARGCYPSTARLTCFVADQLSRYLSSCVSQE